MVLPYDATFRERAVLAYEQGDRSAAEVARILRHRPLDAAALDRAVPREGLGPAADGWRRPPLAGRFIRRELVLDAVLMAVR